MNSLSDLRGSNNVSRVEDGPINLAQVGLLNASDLSLHSSASGPRFFST